MGSHGPHDRAGLPGWAQLLLTLWAGWPQLTAEKSRDGIPPSQRKAIQHDSIRQSTFWRNHPEVGRMGTEETSNRNAFL